MDLNQIIAKAIANLKAPDPAPEAGLVRVKHAAKGMERSSASLAPTRDSAEAFLRALKEAGSRPLPSGRLAFAGDAARREDEILAIRGFMGYVPGTPHGTQLDAARRTASNILRPVGQGAPRIASTVAGFVAGMPAPGERERRDQEGRRRLMIGLVCDLRKVVTGEGFADLLARSGASEVEILAARGLGDTAAAFAAQQWADRLASERGIG